MVTVRGDDYDALQETLEVLSDPELVQAHSEGQKAIAAGDYLDADQLANAIGDRRRSAK